MAASSCFAHEVHRAGSVHPYVGGLEVLVDQAAGVELSQSGAKADGQLQAIGQGARFVEAPRQEIAARVLEDQRQAVLDPLPAGGGQGPGGIELRLEGILSFDALPRMGPVRADRRLQEDAGLIGLPLSPLEDQFLAFPQRL